MCLLLTKVTAPVSLRLPPCSSIRHTNLNSQHTKKKNIHNRGRRAPIPVSAVGGDGSLINVAASPLVICKEPSNESDVFDVHLFVPRCSKMCDKIWSLWLYFFALVWQFKPELSDSTRANRPPKELKVSCLKVTLTAATVGRDPVYTRTTCWKQNQPPCFCLDLHICVYSETRKMSMLHGNGAQLATVNALIGFWTCKSIACMERIAYLLTFRIDQRGRTWEKIV